LNLSFLSPLSDSFCFFFPSSHSVNILPYSDPPFPRYKEIAFLGLGTTPPLFPFVPNVVYPSLFFPLFFSPDLVSSCLLSLFHRAPSVCGNLVRTSSPFFSLVPLHLVCFHNFSPLLHRPVLEWQFVPFSFFTPTTSLRPPPPFSPSPVIFFFYSLWSFTLSCLVVSPFFFNTHDSSTALQRA